MGCICSKAAITRSMSIREDLNNTFQNASVAWEEMLTSRNGNNNHLFAFLYSTNNDDVKTNEPQMGNLTLPSNLEEEYFVNALDFISELEGGEKEEKSTPGFDGELDIARFSRSRSHQMHREKAEEIYGPSSETEGENESKLGWRDKNLKGSRSFHTVEEYDALIERIHKVKSIDENRSNVSYILAKEFAEEARIFGNLYLDNGNFKPVQNAIEIGGEGHELGWRRKAAAKALKSLDVPTIEFPVISRLKQRIHAGGQVYSPGTYVTPKFGSYSEKKIGTRREDTVGESSPLGPELLAAFEDCVHQLQEESDILLQMGGYKHSNTGNGE